MNLSKTQLVRLVSLLECNGVTSYAIKRTPDGIVKVLGSSFNMDDISRLLESGELRDTQHTTTIKARILGCVQSVIVDYDMHKDGSIDIVRMTLEDKLLPIEWSRSIEQLVMVELEKHLPKL